MLNTTLNTYSVFTAHDNTTWGDILSALQAYRTRLSNALNAAAQLDKCSSHAHVTQLRDLLADPEPFVRESAARPLARLQGIEALPALLCAMRECEQNGNPSRPLSNIVAQVVRLNATQVAPLLQNMLNDRDSLARQDAAWCYGFLDEVIAQAPLLIALRDSDMTVRIAAANALRSFSNPTILSALCHALFDPVEQVRVAVAATLSQTATVDTISALSRAQRDNSQVVRVFANYALKRLGHTTVSPLPVTQKPARAIWKLFTRV